MGFETEIRDEMILAALGGIPIMGLVENWSFTIEEIAPYVFKASGESMGRNTVLGHGGTADVALKEAIKKVKKYLLNISG